MINIYEIDNIITTKLRRNTILYNKIKDRIPIYNSVPKDKINGKIYRDIENDIEYFKMLAESENILIFYNRLTKPIIEKYIDIMSIPILKSNKNYINKEKQLLSENYLEIVNSCISNQIIGEIYIDIKEDEDFSDICTACGNKEKFIKDNDVLVCKNCYNQLVKLSFSKNQSYNPSLKKCNYDRTTHFKECIKQYQGKQNTFVNPAVYSDIKKALETQGLLNNTSNNPIIQFENVKKSHIRYFLKELEYTKYYDDYILIHSNLTEQPPPDISHIENELINEFEEISNMYTKMYKNIDRKNFINIQFILYKLLLKHNFPIDDDDFITTKATDRNIESDRICKCIFDALGW